MSETVKQIENCLSVCGVTEVKNDISTGIMTNENTWYSRVFKWS